MKLLALQAKKSLQIADHLLIETYPLVVDPKLLLGVLANIYDAYKNMVKYVLSQKVVPLKTEKGQLEQFIYQFGSKISKDEMESMKKIYDLFEEHKTSSVEFARKQKLVICDDHYELHPLNFEILKKHLQYAKLIQKQLLRGQNND